MAGKGDNESELLQSLGKMNFVHCAIPDMALSETDTKYKIGDVELAYPIAVLADDAAMAQKESDNKKNLPFVSQTPNLELFISGKRAAMPKSIKTVPVGDGVEAAKVLRLMKDSLPCISLSNYGMLGMYVKQLRIAMFLTNSKSIAELQAAPFYTMERK